MALDSAAIYGSQNANSVGILFLNVQPLQVKHMKIFTRKYGVVLGSVLTVLLVELSFNTATAGCRSYAHDKKDAVAYCDKELNCTVPQIVACYGRTNEWKCRCETPKKEKMSKKKYKTSTDYSIIKNMDKASPKLLKH